MPRLLAKVPVAADVLSMAQDRLRTIFGLFDHVAVSFSGGKDSTVVMELAAGVARELGRLPLRVIFWDEECIPVQTEAFALRVRERDDLTFEWLTVPTRYHNSCSIEHPHWYPWAPEEEAIWVRPKPPGTISTLPGYDIYPKERRTFHMGANGYLFDPVIYGRTCFLLGIRAAESLMRTRALLFRATESWLHEHPTQKGPVMKGYPIYDWRTPDVWKAIRDFGWDYNTAYDAMAMRGIAPHSQRISSPFHVEALKGLVTYAAVYPEIADRMLARVPGAATAARYADGELFGVGGSIPEKPRGMMWTDWCILLVRAHPPGRQRYLADRLAMEIRSHFTKTRDHILPQTPHPETGVSWNFLVRLAMRDDWMSRHQPHRLSRSDLKGRARRQDRWDAERDTLLGEGTLEECRP